MLFQEDILSELRCTQPDVYVWPRSYGLCIWRGRLKEHFILEKLTEKGWVGLKVFCKCTIKILVTIPSIKNCPLAGQPTSCVLSCVQLLWTVALQAPLAVGFRRQEYWWVAMPSSRGSSWHTNWTCPWYFLYWQVDSLALAPPGKPF